MNNSFQRIACVMVFLWGLPTFALAAPPLEEALKQKEAELVIQSRSFIASSRDVIESGESFNQKTSREVTLYRRLPNHPPAARLDKIDQMLTAHAEAIKAHKMHLDSYDQWSQAGFPTRASTEEAFDKEHHDRLDQLKAWWANSQNLQKQINLDMRRIDAALDKKTPFPMAGEWSGIYTESVNEKPSQVPFQAHFTQTGEKLQGTITEPNTFDDKRKTLQLKAAVRNGLVIADYAEFDKQYSEAGGYSHSVHYVGTWDAARGVLSGKWFVDGANGPFEMRRTR